MLQHVLSLARGGVIISPQFFVGCTAPVRQRIHFKIAGWVFQALTGQAPAYLAVDCRIILDSDRRKSAFLALELESHPKRLYAIR